MIGILNTPFSIFFSFRMYTGKNPYQIWEWSIHSVLRYLLKSRLFGLPVKFLKEPTSSPAYSERYADDEVVMEQPNFSENVRMYQMNEMNGLCIQYS